MAWIEDAEQKVLLVRQAVGLRLWTLPGGKVKRGESLVKALRRELYEETGLRAQIGSLLGVLDRRDKDAITLLFVAVPNKNSIKVKQNGCADGRTSTESKQNCRCCKHNQHRDEAVGESLEG
jgi:ADP-ribose pyrophosphatase YjhB (NUDIX family)